MSHPPPHPEYSSAATAAWRARAEDDLRADDGWLTVCGLSWLAVGAHRVGSDRDCDVVLPAGVPGSVGRLVRRDRTIWFEPAPASGALVNGIIATTMPLRSDAAGAPDVISIGSCALTVIERGERIGVRVRDRESLARRTFTGRIWFAIDPAWCVPATLIAADRPRQIAITNVLGDISQHACRGELRFTLNGTPLTLDALAGGDGLFLVFRDRTAGVETYGAARFLQADAPVDGVTWLDFNRAVSPPCAFTPHATCPLPPPQNILPLRIPAGERFVG
jgi:uncharacterized protein (DUF1684 family)